MKWEEWRKLYMKINGLEEHDFRIYPEWEDEVRILYEKARDDIG